MSPCSRRTTCPPFRSIEGITVNFSNNGLVAERALGRERARQPRLATGRMVHRARQRLEGRLDNVMRVAAADQVEVQVHSDFVGQRLHKVVHQLGLEVADSLLADGDVVAEVRAPADIDNRRTDGLVERHRRFAEALDPRTISQRIPKRPPDDDPHVFDRMMVVYVQIAAGGDLQIEESVARKALEHVIEERHARFRVAATGAVELERDSHGSLARLALDFRTAFRFDRRQPCYRRGLFFTLQADFVLLHFEFRLLSLSRWIRRCAVPLRARAPRTLPSAPDARPTARAPQSRPSTPRLYWFVSGNRMHPAATRTAPLRPSAARDSGRPGNRRGAPESAGRERRPRRLSPWAAIARDCARRVRDARGQSRWPDRMLP